MKRYWIVEWKGSDSSNGLCPYEDIDLAHEFAAFVSKCRDKGFMRVEEVDIDTSPTARLFVEGCFD